MSSAIDSDKKTIMQQYILFFLFKNNYCRLQYQVHVKGDEMLWYWFLKYWLFTNTYIEAKEIEKLWRMKCEWEKANVDFWEIDSCWTSLESRFFRPWMVRPDNLNCAVGTNEQDFSRFASSPTGHRFESFIVLSILPKSIIVKIQYVNQSCTQFSFDFAFQIIIMIESTLIYLDFFLINLLCIRLLSINNHHCILYIFFTIGQTQSQLMSTLSSK